MTDDTLRVYDAKAADYAELTQKETPEQSLLDFISKLPPGGHALDLGCGPGQSALAMTKAGLTVEAVDGSAEMVKLALSQGLNARQALFSDITGTALYDGIWANFSLLHAPRAEVPGLIVQLGETLKPGGWFHLGMKLGTGEGPDGIGRFYSYFSEAELTAYLAGAGITVAASRTGKERGLAGTLDPFVILLGQKT